ncbi:MAG: hypothetical protein IJ910_03005 [Bacteroidaceae bacterium]|nr:hypothetical protein [Bacteroidaceae bacterium]
MKKILTVMALLMMVGSAKTLAQDTEEVVIMNPKQVYIQKTDSSMTVEVQGKHDDPNYVYKKSMKLDKAAAENAVDVTEEFNFHLPFTSSSNSSRKKEYSNEIHSAAFRVGFNSAIGAPQGLHTNMANSWEIGFSAADWFFLKKNRKVNYSVGLWFNWKNFRMTDNKRFVIDNSDVVLSDYPAGADILFSRLKIFSLSFPLQAHVNLSHGWHMGFGPILNINTHGSLKTRYKLDGEKYLDKTNNIHQQPFTVDLQAVLSYKNCGAYVKWSPCNQLRTTHGPKFQGISTGLLLFY